MRFPAAGNRQPELQQVTEPPSRLDRMIARLVRQRAVLEAAAELVRDLPGPVLEVGLGKGRTFDHLRRLHPDRDVFAFDGSVHAPADCVPAPDRLFVGDFRQTLAQAADQGLAGQAALVHADFGSEDRSRDAEQAAWLGPLIDRLAKDGTVVAADRQMTVSGWQALPAPGEGPWPYFLWRVARP